jgi:hypothetical protein
MEPAAVEIRSTKRALSVEVAVFGRQSWRLLD